MSEKSEERESESVELLPPEYAQAAQEIVEVLIKHEIDPEQYDRLFRVARMLLDVKFDGSTPLERLSKVFTTAMETNPLQTAVMVQQFFQTFLQAGRPAPAPPSVVFPATPIEAARATSPTEVTPVEAPDGTIRPLWSLVEAYVVVFVPEDAAPYAGVFTERTPTVADGSKTFVACSTVGRTAEEAFNRVAKVYLERHADLARIAPLEIDG